MQYIKLKLKYFLYKYVYRKNSFSVIMEDTYNIMEVGEIVEVEILSVGKQDIYIYKKEAIGDRFLFKFFTL